MRRAWVLLVTLLLACNTFPLLLGPPDGTSVVTGGISDTRPYFGKMYCPGGTEVGDFMLATCGCGDWRVLLSPSDGSPQRQWPVQFYSTGDYQATGDVAVFGEDGTNAARGTVDQTLGATSGQLQTGLGFRNFSATRGDAHSLEIQACVLCHIGDNPIWPRPEDHPTYVPGVTDCFECHEVVIN